MLLDQLARGQPFWHALRQLRHVGRRPRQALAKQRLVNPVAAQDRASARRAGVGRQHRGQAEHAAAPPGLHAIDPPPLASEHAVDSVELGQALVEKRVIGAQQIQHRAVVAKHVLKKPNRLLVHRAAQFRERRIKLLVLVVVLVEAANVQPLAGELLGQAPGARVAQQAPRLREQRFVAGQLAGGGGAAQFRIRQRRPQEVTQPRGQLGVCHRHRLRATTRFLTAIQKRRRGQHPGDRQLNRLLVRNLALPQSAIQRPQSLLLFTTQRPPPRTPRKLQHTVKMPRLIRLEAFPKGLNPFHQRFPVRLPRDD